LAVDDRPDDLDALSTILSRPGYNIICARSGAEALKRVLDTDFAVILLDVMMPGMDGFEVATIIKRRPRSSHTPILFLTAANQDVRAIYRAYSVGAVDYLSKPLDEAVVRAKVGIFAELHRKDRRIQQQTRALVEADRREQEHALSELRLLSEKRYRSLVEMIPASVWTANADGAVNFCNHHWFEFTGLRIDESQGDGWRSAVHPDDRGRLASDWETAVESYVTYQTELRLRRADGEYRWHMCHITPELSARSSVRGWLGMFTDCEDLKQAVDARDEFLSVASHELRTPLTTLMLQLDSLARSTAGREMDERSRRRIGDAVRQAQRLDRLVGSLLDVSRISAGRLELELGDVELAELVRQAVERLGEHAQRAGSEIRVRADQTAQGQWDRARLEQVVTNLLANAVKYGQGKPIEVVVDVCEGDRVRLVVADQGIGVPLEQQARIFDRFHRAVSSRNFGGLGMGLYITRQIVAAHGGSIAVRSEPGQGATFIVELPRSAPVAVGLGQMAVATS
jgi:PAS domain S-box-containing protein